MAKKLRMRSGTVSIDVSHVAVEESNQRLIDLLIDELAPVFGKMEAMAKDLCPIGKKEKMSPMYRRKSITYFEQGADGKKKKKYRHIQAKPSKLGNLPRKKSYFIKYDYSTRISRVMGKKWESRQPGRLRDSIKTTVAPRKDKTAVLGFLEAGNDDAFYALFVEYGTYKRAATPFLRTAFNQYVLEAKKAVNRALYRFAEGK